MLENITLNLKVGFFDATPCNLKFSDSKIIFISKKDGRFLHEFEQSAIWSVCIYKNNPLEVEIITEEKMYIFTFPKDMDFTSISAIIEENFRHPFCVLECHESFCCDF